MFPHTIDNGIYINEIRELFKYNKIKHRNFNPKFKSIEDEVDLGRGVILLFRWSGTNEGGHYVYISGYSKKHFECYNFGGKSNLVRRSELAKHIRWSYKNSRYYPKAISVIY